MLISYEPTGDVLTITFAAGVAVKAEAQGTVNVNYDANGAVSSVQIPDASTVLWENGGQVNVVLPTPEPTTTVIETTRVVERPLT